MSPVVTHRGPAIKKGKIRFLSAADVEKTRPMVAAIEAVREAFIQLSSGRALDRAEQLGLGVEIRL